MYSTYINILYNSSTGILRLCNLPEETAESPENGHLPRNLPEETAESPEMVICRVIFLCNLLLVIMAPPKENVRRDSVSKHE